MTQGKELVMVQQQNNSTRTIAMPERRDLSDEERCEVMERFWAAVERIQERNRNMDPEAELAFITQVVEEVRRERNERKPGQAKSDR